MANKAKELKEVLGISPTYLVVGEVTAVDKDKRTCTVRPSNIDQSEEFAGVRLLTLPNDGKGLCVYPKVGSLAVLGRSMETVAHLLQVSEVDEVELDTETDVQVRIGGDLRIVAKGEIEAKAGEAPTEAAVLGEQLNTNLETLIGLIEQLNQALTAFADTQNGVVSASGVLLPLSGALVALSGSSKALLPQIETLKQSLEVHLSKTHKHN